ncbi:5'-methylthioadenosine/adenosylhomocysteine nucleosidase [Noviherbaspirillum cavernae]|uniref:adenosylhomocysteine nucleosidase n=1 Tax=Noviherbaspirillum cavernae TaxID=2320862 RepID=A0A418X571_9BURK|nr:5'-methylthioadenosine/adenosylhomocysteine nucleosidase [Noviherbaspirillum cavernae]RJG07627.1 5'-methylthioadenosine/adenosylhomocysteine nucleosidase [Noviherbaspirillum cavernae]
MIPSPIRLGIISAMHQEQAGLIDNLLDAHTIRRGMRDYVTGSLWDIDCVCVLSRLGKVAAAATAATLIERFGVTHIVFTGVAGAGDRDVRVGDIVIARQLVQHDLDASPLFPRHEVPLTGQSLFVPDQRLTDQLLQAAGDFLDQDFPAVIDIADRDAFRLHRPRIHQGLIASGDEFISKRTRLEELKTALPELQAVEMEGAAVAQVCFEFGVPYAVIRTISDAANEDAPVDFLKFIERVASRYAFGIVRRLCANG